MKTTFTKILLGSVLVTSAPAKAESWCDMVAWVGNAAHVCLVKGWAPTQEFGLHYGSLSADAVSLEVLRVAVEASKLEELRGKIKLEIQSKSDPGGYEFASLPSRVENGKIVFDILDRYLSSFYISALKLSVVTTEDQNVAEVITKIFGPDAIGVVLANPRVERRENL